MTLSSANALPAPAKRAGRLRAERRHQLANAAAILDAVADELEAGGVTHITPADLRAIAHGWRNKP